MRIGLNTKLIGGYTVITLFAVAFIGWSLVTITGFISTIGETERLTERVDLTDDLNIRIQKTVKISGDYLLTGDIRKRDEFDRVVTEIGEIISALEEEKGDEKWNGLIRRVRDGIQGVSTVTVEVMFTPNPIGNKDATQYMEEATLFSELLIADIEESNRIASEERGALSNLAGQRAGETKILLYAFPLVGLFILSLFYFYLKYYITAPIAKLHNGAERISRGDFSHPVEVETGDELEELSGGFNSMAVAIKEREDKLITLVKMVDRINEQLIKTGQYKSVFLANVSHELKTPLTHILGFSELIKMDVGGKLPDEVKKYADNIHKSGNDLLKLIENILAIARGPIGRPLIEMEEFNVKGAALDAIEAERVFLEKKKHSLNVVIDDTIKTIRADKGMFGQIIINLLDNAIKFTPTAGEIELKIIEFPEKDGRMLKVMITDNGIGIAPEMKDKIFNPLEGWEGTITREFGGLKIGLALAKMFVEFHGGNIRVESEPGKGSTFEVSLPMWEEKREEAV